MKLQKELSYRKKRNKNSFMDAFLERRKKAVEFALKGKNKTRYKYTKPSNINNDQEEIIYKNKNNYYNDKEYNKSYYNLRSNLNIKSQSNNNNQICEINTNNKNNLTNNHYSRKNKVNELYSKFFQTDNDKGNKNNSILLFSPTKNEVETNKKYIVKGKIINLNENNKIYYETDNNEFKNIIKNKDNYIYENNKFTSPQINRNEKYFDLKIKNVNFTYSDRTKNKERINNNKYRNLNNNIYPINNNDDKIDYYEGKENHKFYDSNGVNDYHYNYEINKSKKYSKKYDKLNNEKNLYEISPIKNELKNEYNDIDIQLTEKEYENQNRVLQSYSCDKKKLNILDEGDENKNNKIVKVLKESPNTKTVSIIYKSKMNKIEEGKKKDKVIYNKKDNINKDIDLKNKYNNKIKNNDKNNEIEKLKKNLIIKEDNNDLILVQNDEKEPNIQKQFFKRSDYNKEYKKQIVNDIKNKINLLKNSMKNNKNSSFYSNEIDNYYKELKENENKENDNLLIDEYYQKLSLKQNNKSEIKYKNEYKNFSGKSTDFQNKIKNIFDENNLKYIGFSNNKINNLNTYLTEANISKNYNKNKKKYNPEINLISDEINEKIKLLDNNGNKSPEFRNRKMKSSRALFSRKINNLNAGKIKYKNSLAFRKYVSNIYGAFDTARNLGFYFNNRIMPANDI